VHFPPHSISVGRHVRARGRIWRIDNAERGVQGTWVTLHAADEAGPAESCALIWPHDPLPSAAEPRLRRAPRRRAVCCVCAALAEERRGDDLWCAAEADIELHPWQLAPVAAVLRGATRLLLADAVGLGKTIEASLIVAELQARRLMRRALVLTPAALTQAWLETLRSRFHLDATLITAHDVQRWQHRPATAGNPWQQSPIIVASIDLAKQPTAWASLDAVGLDVLVVDEAHHAASDTARGALVAHLAARTPWVVLCSATPHTGDLAQFEALCRLGETGHTIDAPMQVFRRTRSAVAIATPGRALTVLRVRLAADERHLHTSLDAYLHALHRGPARQEPGLHLLCTVLARRLASSPDALRHTLRRRLASLEAAPAASGQAQPSLFDACSSDDNEDEDTDPWSGRAGLDSLTDERQHLAQLLALTDVANGGAKRRALQRLLRRTHEPVVVFSENRATILATARACAPDVRAATLHGGLTPEVRAHVLDTFLRGAARVLLTTDVAGEGLNLQHRARLVVTLDWPWRPHRLEQRIGRVDRLGQQRRVHAVVLSARIPSDERMHRTLQLHSDAADADLRARATMLGTDPASVVLANRVHQQRRWRELGHSHGHRRARAGLWVTPAHRRAPTLIVAGLVRRLSSEGQVIWQQVVGLAVTLHADVADRGSWARIIRQVATDPRVLDACRTAAVAQTAGVQSTPDGAAARIALIRRRLRRSPSSGLQPSMFDRRAEAQVEGGVRARGCLDAHLSVTARVIDAFGISGTSAGQHDTVTVIAVLPPSRLVRR